MLLLRGGGGCSEALDDLELGLDGGIVCSVSVCAMPCQCLGFFGCASWVSYPHVDKFAAGFYSF